jgi:hypothetical protein
MERSQPLAMPVAQSTTAAAGTHRELVVEQVLPLGQHLLQVGIRDADLDARCLARARVWLVLVDRVEREVDV